ncbi:aldehyde dehydrogenase family protein [Marinomonas sp.]|uniref:aldehyde dehydrogenase family protein n=1 Tax=Marinomonas sp. TaxID=1904862 RepID=UPI003BACA85E
MLKSSYPFYLANEAVYANTDLSVHNKYTNEVATKVAIASAADIDTAIAATDGAKAAMKAMPAYQRQAILQHCITRFKERFEELAYALCIEAGKPIKDSRGEVTRLIDTFQIAAEEATRIYGEVMPMDISARAADYQGMWKRVPIGPCSFISPFNFPLNLAAHKIAPAIAAGCPFILKPASLTPVSALIVGEILAETDLPKGAFSILPCHRDGADLFTTDERLKLLSFTGSPDVGWALKAKAGKKPVVLELGGNAACIVDEGTDLDDAVQRIVFGAYYQSGQSCISVQRIIVHESLYDDVKQRLTKAVNALVSGDPLDENTFIGPMISEQEALRLHTWIEDAVAGGATVLAGGKRDGAMLDATLMENVDPSMSVSCQEVFGPVAVLSSFSDFDTALEEVNNSVFGLQAGIFTKDIYKAYKAWDVLEVGGVVIGDVPSWRVDHMPYGGVKDSGLGREGVRFAIEDMTEMKLMVLRTPK